MAKNKYETVLKVHNDYEQMELNVIQERLKDVIYKHGARAISESTGVSTHTLYRYCKSLFLRRGLKPDFIHYCKIMNYGDMKGRKSDEE